MSKKNQNDVLCGIYKITNSKNNKTYVGMSRDIFRRWEEHMLQYSNPYCREGKKSLYHAMREDGIASFSFSIIELCDEDKLEEREIFWIAMFGSFVFGYNDTVGGNIGNSIGEQHSRHIITEKQVADIRRRYANQERRRDVYADYKDILSKGGFDKIWKGENWQHIYMDVYTKENLEFHKHDVSNPGSENGRARLTEEDVRTIRTRKKNGEVSTEVYKDYADKVTLGSFKNTWFGFNWKHIVV